LFDLQKIENNHLDENIAVTVIQIFKNFKINQKIDYFITDNADNNNICIIEIYKQIDLSKLKNRYLYYFDHIINLAAKFFFFDNFDQIFNLQIENINSKLKVYYKQKLTAF